MSKLSIAVVGRRNASISARPEGDWSAFIGSSRADAISRALAAKAKWGGGDYIVLVGTLASEARSKQDFDIVPLCWSQK